MCMGSLSDDSYWKAYGKLILKCCSFSFIYVVIILNPLTNDSSARTIEDISVVTAQCTCEIAVIPSRPPAKIRGNSDASSLTLPMQLKCLKELPDSCLVISTPAMWLLCANGLPWQSDGLTIALLPIYSPCDLPFPITWMHLSLSTVNLLSLLAAIFTNERKEGEKRDIARSRVCWPMSEAIQFFFFINEYCLVG